MQIAKADFIKTKTGLTLNLTVIAPTLGWRNLMLSKVEYIIQPEDGIQDIILSATPPHGPAPTAIELFELTIYLNPEDWFQGARIVTNSDETLLVLREPSLNAKPIGKDMLAMTGVGIREDKLLIDVRYGGGCRKHAFQLNWDGNIMESYPPKIELALTHNANQDNCMALISEQIQFDLSVLQGFPITKCELIVKSSASSFKVTYDPKSEDVVAETLA